MNCVALTPYQSNKKYGYGRISYLENGTHEER
jgi:hypothetical protein